MFYVMYPMWYIFDCHQDMGYFVQQGNIVTGNVDVCVNDLLERG